jgi:mercuric ion transport protein
MLNTDEAAGADFAQESDGGARLAAAGGVLGALAMTSCCILPLALFSLGATGAWIGQMAVMAQYKLWIFGFALACLGYGFWKVYWPAGGACAEGAACARPLPRRVMKASLWGATAVALTALAFPYAVPWLLTY